MDALKTQLQEPLAGMGVAFSSSLLGVGGTLTMGFCIMQLDRAKEAFFQKADFWSSQIFPHQNEFSKHNLDAGLDISMDRWADGIERLGRLYVGAEKRQEDLLDAVMHFSEKTQAILDVVKMQHFMIKQWSEDQAQNRQVLEKVVEKMQSIAFLNDEGVQSHLALIGTTTQQILRHLDNYAWIDVLRQELAMARRLDAQNGVDAGRKAGKATTSGGDTPEKSV